MDVRKVTQIIERVFNDEFESKEFFKELACNLKAGDTVALHGDLGSGKTFACREIIRHFCENNIEVVSPTFNIMQVYQALNCTIYHFDLYRVQYLEELHNIGIDEITRNSKNITLIEWPEIIVKWLPKPLYVLDLKITESSKHSCRLQYKKGSKKIT